MPRIEVGLDDDVHEDWNEHVEEGNRYKTMTQLIRYAVAEQIDRDNGVKSSDTELNPERIESAVQEPIGDLQNDLTSLRNDIVQTQRVVESLTQDEDYLAMAMELHDLVPRVLSVEEAVEGTETGFIEDLAEKYREELSQDISDEQIRIALARLENDVPQVESTVVDGERIYYENKS
jgi:Arc/MetJ-type ribon-helix-helix transcriptional regulator